MAGKTKQDLQDELGEREELLDEIASVIEDPDISAEDKLSALEELVLDE